MLNSPKTITNRLNSQLSTGPKTSRGKRVSSKNSIKHGLNVEFDFESSESYKSLRSLLTEEGYSPFEAADIATSLLNYRRVMDAYYETYTKIKKVDESTWDMNLEGIYMGLRSMAKGSEVTPSETLSVLRVFARSQRNERRQGGPVSRRTVDCNKLTRYQRHSISRLSKAIRSELKK
jgi:hypothetical protein